ncbi:Fic family protein [Flavobacterium gawalongense]|uniref:Fic family protein n=1 Tax=Flavobacterium gawalongense TaxID=2594432 RepID=A0A553BPF6_9FLAO|nr:Fic family protein [Flavobacterium gawalongense]TRX01539.1 Fic family protein [Flavobacterium gawalongense]TRX06110.1 Fic family protein [Flavobacterium gawalongense]TRX10135.1 Fic family protein [Flavobacterium gawalongense]TRX11148.1 Fic family protein [Flavobacterium gawalongense]TRX28797.1 Fic family protein [Flavobacterium gawalongense]
MWNIDLNYREEFQTSFERLHEKKQVLQTSRPLPNIALHKIRESLSIEWTYNSNSIEGNTMSLRETQMVIQEGITIKGKSLREHFETHNHDKAINYLYSIVNEDYNLRSIDILSLHGLVLRSIEDDFAGRIRNGGVRITGANFTPPNANKVPDLLDELIDFINTNPLQLNDIELATVFHHKLVWIHPFFDGNGRTVRLAMNLLLMRSGFPPAIILKNDRKKYYEALNQANGGNYQKLTLLMCQSLERTLNIYINSLPGNDKEYVAISNLVQEPNMPYGQEYISLLARTGKIDAYKEGRNWLTTREAVEDYMATRKRKR